MKVLFIISHPAHFHLFRRTIDNLKRDGHQTAIVIRPKDVLEQLCVNSGWSFIKVKGRSRTAGRIGQALSLLHRIMEVAGIVRKERPDFMIGSDGVQTYVGKLFGIPAFCCNEDDAEATPMYARMFYPWATGIIAPDCCSVGKWAYKKIPVASYHELAYLYPGQFKPDRSKVEQYGIDTEKPYTLIRFAQLTAFHDVGIHGINFNIAKRLIDMLQPYGPVYITSERPLEPELEPYRINIDPLDIHDVMAYASLFVGDSQTMAAEAGTLGIPFVRLNDFVGRLSYLNEIENKYKLGFGHRADDVNGFFASVRRWLETPDRKAVCAERRLSMLTDKIDYSAFLTWFIENYPASEKQINEDPDYQWRFE